MFYIYTEFDKKVHTNLFTLLGNYGVKLKNHLGHEIIMRLLFRGGTNNSFLTRFYENHILTGEKLIAVLNQNL